MSSCALATRAAPSFGGESTRARRQQLPARLRASPLLPRKQPRQRELCLPSASAVDLLDVAAAANARNLVAEAARVSDDDDDDDDDVLVADEARYALSIVDSTDDVFSEYCQAQVELVAHALGRGARCMLYLRSLSGDEGSLQLAEVASYPPSAAQAERWNSSQDDDHYDRTNHDDNVAGAGGNNTTVVAAAAAESFAFAEGQYSAARAGAGAGAGAGSAGSGQAITLSGGGSVDDSDGSGGQVTAAEALLVKQRLFALPSTNALVVPLSRDNALVGLLVGEMPEGGGWKRRRESARTRARRERAKSATAGGAGTTGEVEVEVLSAAASGAKEDDAAEAADTAAQFGDRRQAALHAAARAIVAAWAMHRRANYATAAAVRSDRRVAGFSHAAREPLTVLRTLGGMLSSHLKPDTPSRDMADAIVAQGDVLASLSEELESALYPQQMIEELTAGSIGGGVGGVMRGGMGVGRPPTGARSGDVAGAVGSVDANGSVRGLPAASVSSLRGQGQLKQLPGAVGVSAADGAGKGKGKGKGKEREKEAALAPAPSEGTTATAKALASGHSPSCDVTPIVAGLLASGEVMAKPAGVTMTATFPEHPARALARADPRDVRETLALVIDAALVAAPKRGEVDVMVSANGGSKGGVVVCTTVTAGAGTPAAVGLAVDLPAGALARAAGGTGGTREGSASSSGMGSARAAAREGAPLSWGAMGETQSLKIARSLVEDAGGIFHVLPSLPPTVGRIEMWLPAAAAPAEATEAAAKAGVANSHRVATADGGDTSTRDDKAGAVERVGIREDMEKKYEKSGENDDDDDDDDDVHM